MQYNSRGPRSGTPGLPKLPPPGSVSRRAAERNRNAAPVPSPPKRTPPHPSRPKESFPQVPPEPKKKLSDMVITPSQEEIDTLKSSIDNYTTIVSKEDLLPDDPKNTDRVKNNKSDQSSPDSVSDDSVGPTHHAKNDDTPTSVIPSVSPSTEETKGNDSSGASRHAKNNDDTPTSVIPEVSPNVKDNDDEKVSEDELKDITKDSYPDTDDVDAVADVEESKNDDIISSADDYTDTSFDYEEIDNDDSIGEDNDIDVIKEEDPVEPISPDSTNENDDTDAEDTDNVVISDNEIPEDDSSGDEESPGDYDPVADTDEDEYHASEEDPTSEDHLDDPDPEEDTKEGSHDDNSNYDEEDSFKKESSFTLKNRKTKQRDIQKFIETESFPYIQAEDVPLPEVHTDTDITSENDTESQILNDADTDKDDLNDTDSKGSLSDDIVDNDLQKSDDHDEDKDDVDDHTTSSDPGSSRVDLPESSITSVKAKTPEKNLTEDTPRKSPVDGPSSAKTTEFVPIPGQNSNSVFRPFSSVDKPRPTIDQDNKENKKVLADPSPQEKKVQTDTRIISTVKSNPTDDLKYREKNDDEKKNEKKPSSKPESLYGKEIKPSGKKEEKVKKPRLFWNAMIIWSAAVVVAGSGLSAWGYSLWVDAESDKKANIAYEDGANDIIADPTFESVVRMGDDEFDSMISQYPGNDLPEGYRVTDKNLVGWSIPGGSEANGRADVEVCWTSIDTEGENKSAVYMVSENAQDESPTWIIDSMVNTGEKCTDG